MCKLQSTQMRICQHDAIQSHDTEVTQHTNLCNHKSHILFESDYTFICNNILLHLVKYIYLITFSIPSHHFIYGGVLEINRIVVVYLLTYISQSADYSRVHSTTV